MNRSGPNAEPWGKPPEMGNDVEERDVNWINWVRSERYDVNQVREV